MKIDETNARFDKLTNRDISTHYNDKEYYFGRSDCLAAFAYWAVFQSPYDTPDITKALDAFGIYIAKKIPAGDVVKFTYKDLEKFINEEVLKSIPEIEKLNHAKIEIEGFIASSSRYHTTKPDYDYIDLEALARNIFYMLLREQITQS